MPNRILRDWTDSAAVNLLSDSAEKFFTRLIQKADDFGRYHGGANLLRPMLYPLQLDRVREADIQRWISECETAGLVRRYEAESKQVVEIVKFKQSIRAEKSKFPDRCIADATQVHSKCVASAPVVVGVGVVGDVGEYICNNSSDHPSLKDVLTNGEFIGMSKEASEAFWHHFEASGWIDKNGHEIKNWRSKQTAWKNNMVSLKTEREHHSKPQSNNRPSDIRTIIQAKEAIAVEIRKKFCSDTAIDSVWSNSDKRQEYFKLKREIKSLNTQLSNMA